MALGDVLAFLQSDWVALWAATLHNSMYGNVPGLFSPYKIGLDAPGYMWTTDYQPSWLHAFIGFGII